MSNSNSSVNVEFVIGAYLSQLGSQLKAAKVKAVVVFKKAKALLKKKEQSAKFAALSVASLIAANIVFNSFIAGSFMVSIPAAFFYLLFSYYVGYFAACAIISW